MGHQMGILVLWRGWRAVLLASGMVWFGPAADLWAGVSDSAGTPAIAARSVEPFGRSASVLSAGALREKWRGVARTLDDEAVQLALCDGDRDRCVSPAALRLLAIVDNARARDGRARLGEINRAINLAIRPMSDLAQYGQIDVWSSPLVTFAHGAGDCEDYAIAKFVALRLAGVAPGDLRIVIMRDTIRGEDHAVAAARLHGRWLTLDNRRMAMIEDAHVRNYRPTFVIDQYGIMRYDEPLLAGLPGTDAALANLAPADIAPMNLAPSAGLDPQPGLIWPLN
jgi:predicted transglutaminase-like cysteine proteinase